jgi:hypothetical protein
VNQAQFDHREALNYEQDYHYRTQQAAQQRQYAGQQRQYAAQQAAQQAAQPPSVPEPTEKAASWATDNPWFGAAEHKDMTALAYGIHERLVRDEGIQPDSDEYFTKIDSELHTRFSDYFDAQKPAVSNAPTVVASAERNNGAKPRRVKLNARQVKLIKTLGITPEDYVRQTLSLNEGT